MKVYIRVIDIYFATSLLCGVWFGANSRCSFFFLGSESEVARWANTANRMPESEMTLTAWSVYSW